MNTNGIAPTIVLPHEVESCARCYRYLTTCGCPSTHIPAPSKRWYCEACHADLTAGLQASGSPLRILPYPMRSRS